jgi:hypothetical protein
MTSDNQVALPGLECAPKKARRRNSLLNVLKPVLPNSGRAAAGAASAAKRKVKTRLQIMEGLEKRRQADSSRLPLPAEVALAGGISVASVYRHCRQDPNLARQMYADQSDSQHTPDLRDLKKKLLSAKQVIIEQEADIERLENAYRTLLATCEVLERRIRVADPRLADEFVRGIGKPIITKKPDLRLITNPDPTIGEK